MSDQPNGLLPLFPYPFDRHDTRHCKHTARQDAQQQRAQMGKRKEFDGEQHGMMNQHTERKILQKRRNAHGADSRYKTFDRIARCEQTQQYRTQKGQKNRCRSIHTRRVGKDIDGKAQKESPQHQRVARSLRLELQYQIDVQKGSGISDDMHIVQYQHLQQQQADEPSYFMQIIVYQWCINSFLLPPNCFVLPDRYGL